MHNCLTTDRYSKIHLFLWVVGAVMAPLAARHVKEDEKADDGNKEHPAGNRGNDKHEKTLFLSFTASVGGHKDLARLLISLESYVLCVASSLKL